MSFTADVPDTALYIISLDDRSSTEILRFNQDDMATRILGCFDDDQLALVQTVGNGLLFVNLSEAATYPVRLNADQSSITAAAASDRFIVAATEDGQLYAGSRPTAVQISSSPIKLQPLIKLDEKARALKFIEASQLVVVSNHESLKLEVSEKKITISEKTSRKPLNANRVLRLQFVTGTSDKFLFVLEDDKTLRQVELNSSFPFSLALDDFKWVNSDLFAGHNLILSDLDKIAIIDFQSLTTYELPISSEATSIVEQDGVVYFGDWLGTVIELRGLTQP